MYLVTIFAFVVSGVVMQQRMDIGPVNVALLSFTHAIGWKESA